MKIVIVGTGYVGLVTGTCFAELGLLVTCVDTNHDVIHCLSRGELPIYEPGLQAMLDNNVSASRLHFTSELGRAICDSDMIFYCSGYA